MFRFRDTQIFNPAISADNQGKKKMSRDERTKMTRDEKTKIARDERTKSASRGKLSGMRRMLALCCFVNTMTSPL